MIDVVYLKTKVYLETIRFLYPLCLSLDTATSAAQRREYDKPPYALTLAKRSRALGLRNRMRKITIRFRRAVSSEILELPLKAKGFYYSEERVSQGGITPDSDGMPSRVECPSILLDATLVNQVKLRKIA